MQTSMPPPSVAMAPSNLKIKDLQDQLKEKNKIIGALQVEKQAYLAATAEEARNKEYAKMNKGWRKHNAVRPTPSLLLGNEITKDERRNINHEKTVFISEYRIAMERVKEMNAEAGRAKARVRKLRQKQKNTCCRTQELIKAVEELVIKLGWETRMRIADSSPEEDQDTTATDMDTTNSDGDVNMGDFSTTTAPKTIRLVLNPPKRERSLPERKFRATRLKLSMPKQETSQSVEATRPTRIRLSMPKKKDFEESPLPAEASRHRILKLNPPKPEKARDGSDRVLCVD